MLQAGAPLGYVSTQLGHRNAHTTLTFYAHWVKHDERDQQYANVLEPKAGTKTPQRAINADHHSDVTGSSS
jgi:hypothetical protein